MLGDGIVSFGVAPCRRDRRKAKSSPKIVSLDAELAVDAHRGRRELDVALGVVELDRQVAGRLLDAVELVDEVHVPRGAAELAVGGRLQADVLLHAHHVADRVVLDRAQLVGVDPALGVVLARRSSSGGRSRLPTWSARYGGEVRRSWLHQSRRTSPR